MAQLHADPSNAEAVRAWDGADGAHWVRFAERYDESVAYHHVAFLGAANLAPDDRVLDIGCGTGQATRDAARVAASAHGVDLSSAMVEYARRITLEQGIGNATFEQADAQVHAFPAAAFDVAVSRTGAMFFGDPVGAFANIGHALRCDGRLTLVVWQAMTRNEWVRAFATALSLGADVAPPPPDAPGPFSMGDPDRVRSVLDAAGFSAVRLEPSEGPMYFGADADDAYAFLSDMGFTKWRLSMLDDRDRPRALEALRSSLIAHETVDGVVYESAAWIVTATRRDSSG